MNRLDEYEWDTVPMEIVEMGYEDYLNRLFESIHNDRQELEPTTGVLFCGCDTCCTRETIAYLMPRIIELYEQGHIRKVEEVPAP